MRRKYMIVMLLGFFILGQPAHGLYTNQLEIVQGDNPGDYPFISTQVNRLALRFGVQVPTYSTFQSIQLILALTNAEYMTSWEYSVSMYGSVENPGIPGTPMVDFNKNYGQCTIGTTAAGFSYIRSGIVQYTFGFDDKYRSQINSFGFSEASYQDENNFENYVFIELNFNILSGTHPVEIVLYGSEEPDAKLHFYQGGVYYPNAYPLCKTYWLLENENMVDIRALGELEAEIDSLNNEIVDLQNTIDSMATTVSEYEATIDSLQASNSDLNAEITNLNSVIIDLEDQITELNAEIDYYDGLTQYYQYELASANLEIGSLNAEIEDLEYEIDQLIEKWGDTNQTVIDLQLELQYLNEDLVDLENEYDILEVMYSNSQDELVNALIDLNSVEILYNTTVEELESAINELDISEELINDYYLRLLYANSTIESLISDRDYNEELIKSLQDQLEQLGIDTNSEVLNNILKFLSDNAVYVVAIVTLIAGGSKLSKEKRDENLQLIKSLKN